MHTSERTDRSATQRNALIASIAVFIAAGVVAAPLVFARTSPASAQSTEAAVAAGQAAVTIEIPEASCAACSLRARQAVKSVGGVLAIADGDSAKRLVITYEPATGRPDAYVAALQKAGFEKAHTITGK